MIEWLELKAWFQEGLKYSILFSKSDFVVDQMNHGFHPFSRKQRFDHGPGLGQAFRGSQRLQFV